MRTTTRLLAALFSMSLLVSACGPAEDSTEEELETEGTFSSEEIEIGAVSQDLTYRVSPSCGERQFRAAHCNPRNANKGIIQCKARHNGAVVKSSEVNCKQCISMGRLDSANIYCKR